MLELRNFKISLKYLVFFLINTYIRQGRAFNLSPVPSMIIKEPDITTYTEKTRSSYFGYSIVLREKSIIIGAPRAQSTIESQRAINETGAIYRCTLPSGSDSTSSCQPFIFSNRPNIEAKHYLNSELQDFQWLGATMDGSGNDSDKLLVCAPRFSGGYDKTGNECYMHGVCYWSINTLSDKPAKAKNWILKPLTNAELQWKRDWDNTPIYNYQMGQEGFSAHITPNNEEFLLGAPGIALWEGSIIRFNTYTEKYNIPNNVVLKPFVYAGYSVSSGFLDDSNPKQIFYVATIPHGKDENELGEAFIFDISDRNTLERYANFQSLQYGEFFGYAALVADVDGDGLPDVLITAPLHSLKLQPDVGAVHIFLNKGSFHFEPQLLESPFSSMARFGTSISNLGDINLDGFNDIAVGAPFADTIGAVAIYLGSSQGLHKKPSQIINYPKPDNILANSQPYMFGHGLSKGVDIDHNDFNDLAIGAPESEKVFVYHSYPVVDIKAFVLSESKKITDDNNELPIKICWQLHTNSTKINQTEILLKLEADPHLGRVIFGNNHTYEVQFHEKALRQQQCRTLKATVRYAHIFTPIIIEMKYGLEFDGTKVTEYCSRCAVLNSGLSSVSRDIVTYAHGCKGSVCNVDLQLQSNHIPEKFVQGSAATLPISFNISNKGEKAFDAEITISNIPNVAFVKIPRECILDTVAERHTLICQLGEGQAFAAGATTIINLLLDISNITTETLVMQADVSSFGYELEPNDNNITNVIILEEHADIIIMAKPLLPFIHLNKAYKTLTVESVVELENTGPSTLCDFIFTFWTPVAYSNASLNETHNIFNLNNTFLNISGTDASAEQRTSQLSYSTYNSSEVCFESYTADNYFEKFSLPLNRTIMMDCLNSEVICAESNFTIKQFKAHKKLTLRISYELESELVQKMMKDTFDYVAIVPMLSIKKNVGNTRNVTINYKINPTILVNSNAPTISLWNYILSVIGGLLILSLLIYGLLRIGFFKRKAKDELLRRLEVKKLERYSVVVEEEQK